MHVLFSIADSEKKWKRNSRESCFKNNKRASIQCFCFVDSDPYRQDKVGNGTYFKVTLNAQGELEYRSLEYGTRDYNRIAKWVEKEYNSRTIRGFHIYSQGHVLFNNKSGWDMTKRRETIERHPPSVIKTEEQVIALLREYAVMQTVKTE